MEMTDIALVRGCLDGNQLCFEELVKRYKKLICTVVYPMVKDRDEVEDIAQETFIRIYKNLHLYNPQYKFSTWSVRVARNQCLDTLRKKKSNYISIDEFEFLSKDHETPEASYMQIEHSREIQKVIDDLPEKYRNLIHLYHQKGASYKEMTQILGEPMSIIKNRLHRARHILKERLVNIQSA